MLTPNIIQKPRMDHVLLGILICALQISQIIPSHNWKKNVLVFWKMPFLTNFFVNVACKSSFEKELFLMTTQNPFEHLKLNRLKPNEFCGWVCSVLSTSSYWGKKCEQLEQLDITCYIHGCWNIVKIKIAFTFYILSSVLLHICFRFICMSYVLLYFYFRFLYISYFLCYIFLFAYYLVLNLCDNVLIFIICTKLLYCRFLIIKKYLYCIYSIFLLFENFY